MYVTFQNWGYIMNRRINYLALTIVLFLLWPAIVISEEINIDEFTKFDYCDVVFEDIDEPISETNSRIDELLLAAKKKIKQPEISKDNLHAIVWSICKYHNKRWGHPSVLPFHLKVLGNDPSFEFKLEYFNQKSVPLRSHSRFRYDYEGIDVPPKEIEKYKDSTGSALVIQEIKVRGRSANVTVRYYVGPRNGIGYTVTLVKKTGQWLVSSYTELWIS